MRLKLRNLVLCIAFISSAPHGFPDDSVRQAEWSAQMVRGLMGIRPTSRPSPSPSMLAMIERVAKRTGVKPSFLKALVACESGFQVKVVSPAGALGPAQLLPSTARDLGVDPHDPEENIDGGARYIRSLVHEFGDVEKALWAYNWGPNRVRSGATPPRETRTYAKRVIRKFREFEQSTGRR